MAQGITTNMNRIRLSNGTSGTSSSMRDSSKAHPESIPRPCSPDERQDGEKRLNVNAVTKPLAENSHRSKLAITIDEKLR